MDSSQIASLIKCAFVGCLASLCAFNICTYYHVDRQEIVKRLLAVKNSDFKEGKLTSEDFTSSKSKFRFKIFSKVFKNLKFAEFIKSLLEQADIAWQVDTFIIVSISMGIIPLFFALLISPVIAVLCPLGLFTPFIYAKSRIRKRTMLFTQQLPDALDLLCNSLRAGHSLFSAFEVIVTEMPNPISKIFKVLTDEITLGIDAKDAMKSLQDIVPDCVDLRFFTTVVILQREIGGNLIKLLEILSVTIRERFKMLGQLKAQTAQARISGIIVSSIPPIICVVLFFMAPDYMNLLINHIWGKCALCAAGVLMVIGAVVIKKITDIEV